MPRQTRAAQHRAVEERTRQRLAARKEAAQRGAETKRRKRQQATQGAPERKVAPQEVVEERTERPERDVARQKAASDRGEMVTVALRGESAARLRALAASQKLNLSKLLVAMMEAFEAQNR